MLSRPSPVVVPEHEQHWLPVVEELATRAAETVHQDDVTGELPIAHLRALSGSGLDAAALPCEHGGESLSYALLGQAVRALAAAHPAVATVWLMHLGAARSLVALSPPEAAAFFAAELKAGKRFANALSEPAGGNHFLSSQQDAEPADDGWRLDGVKLFVSGAEAADHLILNARVDGQPSFFGVTVDDTVSLPPIEQTMGMRSTRSRTIRFEGTPLRAGRRCLPPSPGSANLITVAFAFLSIGIGESALDALAAHARSKRDPVTGELLADAGWVRAETASVWAELRAARLLAEQSTWLADQGSPEALPNATEAKMLANEAAKSAAALALRVGGGSAYLQRSPIQRIFRDAQAGALMAYSVPFSQSVVGSWVLNA